MLKITGWEALSNLVLFLMAVLLYKKTFKWPYTNKWESRLLAVSFVFIIYLYSYHSKDYIGNMALVNTRSSHFEDVYIWIADFVSGNYFLFRLMVFGTSYIITLYSIKRLNFGFDLFYLFYLMTAVTVLSYGRFTLAQAISFMGFLYIVKPFPIKIPSIIIGGLLIFFSVFFHRSAIIIVPIYMLSLFVNNITKRNIYMALIGLVVIIVYYYYNGLELLTSFVNSAELEEFEAYRAIGEATGDTLGLGMILSRALDYTPYYLSLVLFFLVVTKHNYNKWPTSIKCVSTFFVLTVFVATLLSIQLGNIRTTVLFYRVLYYSTFAMAIFLAYCYKTRTCQKLVKCIAIIALLAQIYTISYHTYQAFLGAYVLFN